MPGKAVYDELFVELEGFLRAYSPPLGRVARMATMCTMVMKREPNFTYFGFYLVTGYGDAKVLEVGPYQGSVLACGRINIGEGVCGQAVTQRAILNVPDVTSHPGYIACDDETLSELVIPISRDGEIIAVLDIDARDLNFFKQSDIDGLTRMLTLI